MHSDLEMRPARVARIAWPRLVGLGVIVVGSAAFWIWLAELVISR